MTTILDGFGKPCPMPLVMAKKELDAGNRDVAIQVDNETAVKNITRLAEREGLGLACDAIEGGWLLTFSEGDASAPAPMPAAPAAAPACSVNGCGYAVFVGSDRIGSGDDELGRNLMKMALFTLSESEQVPASLLFMNAGVKLVSGEAQQTIEHVRALEERGCEVLVCGTCLDFYGLKDSLGAGTVSNMYDIVGRMQEAAKVISL